VTLPPYAREALADALLYLHQPRAALAEYEAVLAADPHNEMAQGGRFYATVELEDFAAAYELADEWLAAEPVWRRYEGDPTLYPRDQYLYALLRAAAVRLYGDQPDAAWQRVAPERDAAPANLWVRLTAAAVMNAREWPREAEQENRIALSLAPDSVAAQIAVADIALVRGEFAEARARIAELAAVYPENLQVQRLERDLAARTGWQLDAEARPAQEFGGGPNGSGREIETSARITSPLIDNKWRLFAEDGFADARPPEGYVSRQRVASGLELRLPDFTAALSVHHDFGTLERTGFTAMLDAQPNDHLSLGLSAERISNETPLRALLTGVTADSVNTRVTWTWDESRSASVGVGWLPFSDGNQRTLADARYTQKIIAVPHFSLGAQAELYTSANTLPNAAYYNPRADGSATIGLTAEHMIWRRYDRSLTQVLTLAGGMYGERYFRGGPIGSVSYEHRWRFDPWTAFSYGVSLSERLYDGEPAHTFGAFVALHQAL
jgi:biofilm PGA synthesis protein PgaA